MKRRRKGHALRRRYGRAAGAEELYREVEAAYKHGLEAVREGDLATARAEAIRVGVLALKANRQGLDPKKYGTALRAQSILLAKAA